MIDKTKPREKLYYQGLKNLNNVELLALVLSSGSQKESVMTLAKKLNQHFPLNKFHQFLILHPLDSAEKILTSLQIIPGIGPVKAGQVLAAIELGRRSLLEEQLVKLNSPQLIFEHASELRNRQTELCLAFFLNAQSELLLKKIISIGGNNFNYLEGREIFEIALKLQASQIILAHNHPSNNLEPSIEDLQVSQKIAQLAEFMGLKLEDHLIIGQKGYFSIRENLGELTALDADLANT